MRVIRAHIPEAILLILGVLFFLYSMAKIYAPGAGLIGINQTHWSYSDYFDQTVSLAVAKNFAKNGVTSNFGMQDRSGIAIHSSFDVPCHGKALSPVTISSFEENSQDIQSLGGKCVYTKAPPLIFGMYGFIYKIFDNGRAVRVTSVLIHLVLLFTCFIFLKRFFGVMPAFFTTLVYFVSPLYWGWAHFLYSLAAALMFCMLCFYFFHSKKSKPLLVGLFAFLAAFSVLDILPVLTIYPWLFALFSWERKKARYALLISVCAGASLLVTMGLSVGYLGGIRPFIDEFIQLSERYQFYGTVVELFTFLSDAYFSRLLRPTFYPPEVLFILFGVAALMLRKHSKKYFFITTAFSLMVASLCIGVISPEHTSYHIRALFYFSQLFWLFLIGAFFYGVWESGRKRVSYGMSITLVFFSICYSIPFMAKDSSQLVAHYKNYDVRDISRNIVDVTMEFAPSPSDLHFFVYEFWPTWEKRMSLIDGTFPPIDSGVILDPKRPVTFRFFLDSSYYVNKFELLVSRDTSLDFLRWCKLKTYDYRYQVTDVASNEVSFRDQNEQSHWVQIPISSNIRGLSVHCDSEVPLTFYEISMK